MIDHTYLALFIVSVNIDTTTCLMRTLLSISNYDNVNISYVRIKGIKYTYRSWGVEN